MRPEKPDDFDELGSLLQKNYGSTSPSDEFAGRLEQRLAALLPAEGRSSGLTRARTRTTGWIGGLTMRQRLALGGIGVAALLGFLLFFGGVDTKPLSAMEQMAESVRKAKSCKGSGTMQVTLSAEPRIVLQGPVAGYWLANGSKRLEVRQKVVPEIPQFDRLSMDMVFAQPAGKAGIRIDHKNRDFYRIPANAGEGGDLIPLRLFELDTLGKFSAEADRELGTKEIDGKEAHGFEIDAKKIVPKSPPGRGEIWIDARTKLPVLVIYELKVQFPLLPPCAVTIRINDIQWNVHLDPKVFELAPPEGYRNRARPEPLDEQVRRITQALKIYADASSGHYPQMKAVDAGKMLDDLRKNLGLAATQDTSDPSRADRRALRGIQLMDMIQAEGLDSAYFGQTVGPNDKDKVLFRWILEDGRYEVVFGDLKSETVTAERIRALEANH